MNYIGFIIVFIGTLIGIRGFSWDSKKTGFDKITGIGWLAFYLSLFGVVWAAIATMKSEIEAELNAEKVESLEKTVFTKEEEIKETVITKEETVKRLNSSIENYKSAQVDYKKQILELEASLKISKKSAEQAVAINAKLERQLGGVQGKIESYEKVVNDIRKHTDQGLELMMTQVVSIPSGETWRAPSDIARGALLEVYFYKGSLLEVKYDNESEEAKRSPNDWYKAFVRGNSTEGMEWSITNRSKEIFEGKVAVFSTPRSRSKEWGWMEERLGKLNKKAPNNKR